MSTTYSLACHDCKQRYWAGQSNYLYDSQKVAEFLYAHVGHKIEFVNDLVDDELLDDYKELDKQG